MTTTITVSAITHTARIMIELLLPPLLAGLAVAIVAGPMGAFVVWRRMAFFGDTLAHGALLGAAFALAAEVSLYPAVVLVCLLLALLLVALQQQRKLASDTLLGIVSHTTLALGIIAISLQPDVRIDLFAFLFGDLLSVSMQDVLWLWLGAAGILALMVWGWRSLLSITVDEDLAQVEGIPLVATRTLLMLLLAVLIAGAIRTVGVLLITSLLVMPAASARRLSKTPESMAILASLFGVVAVLGGLTLSWYADTPVGPSVVVVAALLFVASFPMSAQQARRS